MCSTMEELAGQDVSTYIGVIGSSLADPAGRRLSAKSLEVDRPRDLWFSLGCETSRAGDNRRTEEQKQEERETQRRFQQEYKGALFFGMRAKRTWRRDTPM